MVVTHRPESPQDEPFIRSLILETIADELMAGAWPQPMREHLLETQYVQRRQSARLNYPEGEGRIILADEANAGWIYLADLAEELWLAEIILVAGYRNRGLGSALMRRIIAGAESSARPVRLRVNIMNARAGRFYDRLGFQRVGGDEVQHLMEYAASTREHEPC